MKGFDEKWLAQYASKRGNSAANSPAKEPAKGDAAVPAAPKTWPTEGTSARKGVPKGVAFLDGREDEFKQASAVMTLKDMAAHFGCSEITISRMRVRFGLPGKAACRNGKRRAEEAEFIKIHDTMSDAKLAERFGLTVSGVEKRRATLGLKKNPSLRWEHTPHPKGNQGKTHSPEVREAMSIRVKQMWANPNSYCNSEEYRQKLSDRFSLLSTTKTQSNAYSRCSHGMRPDLNHVFFRSAWEANYARYLNLLIKTGDLLRWEYEPVTFWFEKIKRGVRSYKPDFRVWPKAGEPYFVEVKGWMDAKSKTKLSRMAKYYPDVKIVLVDQKEYRSIARTASPLIPTWEGKYGVGHSVKKKT